MTDYPSAGSFGGSPTTDSSEPEYPSAGSFGGRDPEKEAAWHDISALPYTPPSWSDYGHSIASASSHVISGFADAGANLARRQGDDDLADNLSRSARNWSDTAQQQDEAISPNAKANLDAGVLSGRFWQHPFSSSTLKLSQQAPALGAIVGAGAVGGAPGVVGAGAAMGWAGYADALHEKVFGTDDTQLRNENSDYDSWRSGGMSENDAKSRLVSNMFSANGGDIAAAAIGGVAGLTGPAGRLVGGASGIVGREATTILGGMKQGALEGFLTGAGQTALTDYALGVTEQDYHVGEMPSVGDIAKDALSQGLEFGVLGGITGGVGGGLAGIRERAEARERSQVTQSQPVVGDTRDPTPPPARPVETVGKEVTGDTPTGASDQGKEAEAKEKHSDPVGGENVSIPSKRWGRKPVERPADLQIDTTRAPDTGKPAPASPITDDATREALTKALPQEQPKPTTDSGDIQQPRPVEQAPAPARVPPVRTPSVPETSQEQPVQPIKPVVAPPPTSKGLQFKPPERTDLIKDEIPDTPQLPVVTPTEEWYHGSPNSQLDNKFSNFNNDVGFFTKDHSVAQQYATEPIMGAQKTDVRGEPTVYKVNVDQGNVFDLRNPEHQAIYEDIKNQHNAASTDPDDRLPNLNSEGFIMRGSGLPGFGNVRPILSELAARNYHSMLVDDGAHGISLAVNQPQNKVDVLERALPIVGEAQREIGRAQQANATLDKTKAAAADYWANLAKRKLGPSEDEGPVKTKKGAAAVAKRVSNNRIAEEIVSRHLPTEMDARALLPDEKGGVGARNVVRARIAATLADAEKEGVKIPKLFREPKSDLPPHSNALILLDEMQKFFARKNPDTKEYERFLMRENDIRQGRREDVLEERKAQAEEALAKQGKGPRAGLKFAEPDAAERVAEVREHVEEPTEAQAEAGNYAKGHPGKLEGQEVTIETPQGGTRKGVDAQGRKWEVTSKTDYGYILGTKGADGDHVDVHIGPKGETGKIFVMNQLDPATGEFDEHKVFMGYDTATKAMADYRENFDEPKSTTNKRIGEVVPMDRSEFNDWLRNGDLRQPVGEGISGADGDGSIETSRGRITPHTSTTVNELLQDVSPKLYAPQMRGAMKILINKIMEVAGDVKVHLVNAEDMDKLLPEGEQADGVYDDKFDHIVLDTERNPDVENSTTIVHEAFHAATLKALKANKGLRNLTERLWKEADPKGNYDSSAEFLTHLMTDPEAQEKFAHMKISDDLANDIGIPAWRKKTIFEGVLAAIRKAFGMGPRDTSALEAAMAISERAIAQREPELYYHKIGRRLDNPSPSYAPRPAEVVSKVKNLNTEVAKAALSDMGSNLGAWFKKGRLKLLAGTQIDDLWGHRFTDEHGRIVTDINRGMEKQYQLHHAYSNVDKDIINKAQLLAKKYKERMSDFGRLLDMSTSYGIHADEDSPFRSGPAHKGSMEEWQQRKYYPQARELYDNLPEELQSHYGELKQFYKDKAQALGAERLDKLLQIYEPPSGSLLSDVLERAQRQDLTDEDMDHYRELGVADQINDAYRMMKAKGPYFNAYRDGDFIVKGEYDMPEGGNKIAYDGTDLNKNVREFDTREEAHEYATGTELPATSDIVYYNPLTKTRTTKEAYAKDPKQNPIQKFRVRLQNEHVEFGNTYAEAKAQRAAMEEAGVKNLSQVLDRRNEASFSQLSSAQSRSWEAKIKARNDISEVEKDNLIKSAREMALANQTGNRLSKHWVTRRNVRGADFESADAIQGYSRAANYHLARSQALPTIDSAMKRLRDFEDAHAGDADAYNLSAIANEMRNRVYGTTINSLNPKTPAWLNRIMQLSFMKFLIRGSHILLQQLHPYLYSAPNMGGRHGYWSSMGAIRQAMNDLGGNIPNLWEGARASARMAKSFYETDIERAVKLASGRDAFEEMIKRLKPQEQGVLRQLLETGHLHSGFDASLFEGKGLDRVNAMIRQLTDQMDANNRLSTGLAAYRLELAKTGNHNLAIEYARKQLELSQGVFSPTNIAPIFRDPRLRPFMQFRQYPMQIMYMLTRNVVKAFHGETPEIKQEALRSLSYELLSAAALSGVAGLPLDVLKPLGLAGYALGITPSPSAMDDKARRALADETSPTIANVIMDGPLSLLGPFAPSIAHRAGFETGLFFGEPYSDKPSDVKAWLFDTLIGAPGSWFTETGSGLVDLMNGNFSKAGQELAPIATISDLFKAYTYASEGVKSGKGVEILPASYPYAALQLLGFQPQQIARTQEGKRALTEELSQERTEKSQAISELATTTGSDMFKRLQQWNVDHPESLIRPADIQRERKQLLQSNVLGVRETKQNKQLLSEYERVYGQ